MFNYIQTTTRQAVILNTATLRGTTPFIKASKSQTEATSTQWQKRTEMLEENEENRQNITNLKQRAIEVKKNPTLLTKEEFVKKNIENFENYIEKPAVKSLSNGCSKEDLENSYKAYCQVSYNRYLLQQSNTAHPGRAYF